MKVKLQFFSSFSSFNEEVVTTVKSRNYEGPLLRYYEIIRYNETFLLRLSIQRHHPSLPHIEIIGYFEIHNYEISL